MPINALRGHCGEFGIVVAQGASKVAELIGMIEDHQDEHLPTLAREALGSLVEQLRMVQAQILSLEKKLMAWHRASEASRRLATIPGIGVITATALVATIGNASQFHSCRQLAAWLGLVPRQYSSGGKKRLGRISKRGDGYIRRLLVHGARGKEYAASRGRIDDCKPNSPLIVETTCNQGASIDDTIRLSIRAFAPMRCKEPPTYPS